MLYKIGISKIGVKKIVTKIRVGKFGASAVLLCGLWLAAASPAAAEDAPLPHPGPWPIWNWHNHQPRPDQVNTPHDHDAAPGRSGHTDRLYMFDRKDLQIAEPPPKIK